MTKRAATAGTPRERRARRPDAARRAALLAPDVASVDYKDTVLLARFLSDRGKIRSRSVTGITVHQQRLVARAIKNAREMALLPYQGHSGGRR